jgi:hypothetical protein
MGDDAGVGEEAADVVAPKMPLKKQRKKNTRVEAVAEDAIVAAADAIPGASPKSSARPKTPAKPKKETPEDSRKPQDVVGTAPRVIRMHLTHIPFPRAAKLLKLRCPRNMHTFRKYMLVKSLICQIVCMTF